MLKVRDDVPGAFEELVEAYQHRLVATATHLALTALRARRRRPVVPLDARDSGPLGPRPAEQLVQDRGGPPAQRMQQQELAAIVRRALDGLNERQRMAVVLNKFED